MPRHCLLFSSIAVCFGFLLAAESLAQVKVIRPLATPGPLDNPLKGWCPYTDAGTIHQPYSMVFQYVSWRDLEPVENDFRFQQWEESWDSPRGKDKHIIFRVYIDYPKKPSGMPDWLRDAGVKETAYTDYGGGMSPDYNDPIMVDRMERLIAAMGERYNNHPRVAFIQIGLLGFWGEWHTYPRPELYASAATEKRIIDAYRKAFPNKSLMVRYAKDYAGTQDWIGFHDDMFPEDTDNGKDWSFLAGLRKQQRIHNWKVAVVGGEMVPGKSTQWLGKDYQTTMEMLQRAHFTWVGPYCPALAKPQDDTFQKRNEELVRKMGYEFQIVQVAHPASTQAGQSAEVSLKGLNNGVAPFYYPWLVQWALIDGAGKIVYTQNTDLDIRNWMPGEFQETTTLEIKVGPGNYRLALGIRDPWKDRPAIHFANELATQDGWTVVSEFDVKP